jgi:TolB-like protein/DNA-binding winged helix-turn-helix (wHTH) protein
MSGLRLPIDVWRFGVFEVDLRAEELRKNGIRIHLQGQPFHVLRVLLTRAGQLVTREELRREVWPEDTFVEFDHALNTAVKKIRCALGDNATAPRYVQTISRRGYRFIAEVHAPAPQLKGSDASEVAEPTNVPPERSAVFLSWKKASKALPVSALVVLLVIQLTHRTRVAQDRRSGPVVLAILPFDDWSDDSKLDHLSEGVCQELITQIGRMDPARLAVTARASVQAYRHSSKTVPELGKELHADYLMQGNLRGDRQHVRLSAELVRVKDQARVWSNDFDLDGDDLLTLETDLANVIGAQVKHIMFSP